MSWLKTILKAILIGITATVLYVIIVLVWVGLIFVVIAGPSLLLVETLKAPSAVIIALDVLFVAGSVIAIGSPKIRKACRDSWREFWKQIWGNY